MGSEAVARGAVGQAQERTAGEQRTRCLEQSESCKRAHPSTYCAPADLKSRSLPECRLLMAMTWGEGEG